MSKEIAVKVPDIGGALGVDVIEILVKPGDEIAVDTSLIVLESDKASMEIPSPMAGKVKEIKLALGDKVSEGDVILTVMSEDTADVAVSEASSTTPPQKVASISNETAIPAHQVMDATPVESFEVVTDDTILAGPAVRRMARELGVDLTKVVGSGREGRIIKEDVDAYVKGVMQGSSIATSGFQIPKIPEIDFSVFGPVTSKPLNKIKRLTAENMSRSWVTVPHVTQFDEADVTALEAFRKSESSHQKDAGYKLTLLAFAVKAVTKALAVYPQFNSSLNSAGTALIIKEYVNIGIAVETPNGLVVPILKNVNQLSVSDIAREMGRLSKKAREKGLLPQEMSGGTFTISSLGGIGGTQFTPIVNAPEVAILGLSRTALKPVLIDDVWQPRLMLPLSLSYDHRVIDGAEAARFTSLLSALLGDIRRILL